jgi:hypothetical protein
MGGIWTIPVGRAAWIVTIGVVMVTAFLVGPTQAAGNATPAAVLSHDVTIEMGVALNPVHSQSEVLLKARVENRGRVVAESARVVFEIPSTGLEVEDSAEHCTAVGSTRLEDGESIVREPWTVICELGALPPKSAVNLTFLVTSGSPGTHVISASLTSGRAEANRVDDRAELPLHVLPDEPAILPAFQEPGHFNRLNRTNA